MSLDTDVPDQPVFYLFIAATVLLSLGYSWGRRRNHRIFRSAFDELVAAVRPRDQSFTNIGGMTGYHANLVPARDDVVSKVEATITLLPRQALLYYPLSVFIRRYDRLFITLSCANVASSYLGEGHIIERRYSGFRGPKIADEGALQREELRWGGMDFFLYFSGVRIRDRLQALMERLATPGPVRHVAFVPSRGRVFVFMVPRPGSVRGPFEAVYEWVHDALGGEGRET